MNSGNSNKGNRKYGAGMHNTPKKVRFFGGGERNAAKKEKNQKSYSIISGNNSNNKFWIAALAGASAGIIAGLLMAPESGKDTLGNLRRKAMRLGDELDETFRALTGKAESLGLTRPGDSLQVQGKWDQVKGKLKAQYGDLTDHDLAYIEGQEDTLLGKLESKLGKSKQELVNYINSLV
jgi:uncharacterized protein YjbJ (UPF0337 family)